MNTHDRPQLPLETVDQPDGLDVVDAGDVVGRVRMTARSRELNDGVEQMEPQAINISCCPSVISVHENGNS